MTIYQRFDVKINVHTAQRRFVNRLFETVFNGVLADEEVSDETRDGLQWSVAFAIGERYNRNVPFSRIVGVDLYTNLLAVETVYHLAASRPGGEEIQRKVGNCIQNSLKHCETDISIGWDGSKFFRRGAEELDRSLVNQPLQWLNTPELVPVRQPFEKALKLFLQAQRNTELYSDVITNAYESLEALAKLVTHRDKDLSANADALLKTLSLSQNMRPLVKEYLKYANHFRHGVTQKKAVPSTQEVESFVYLTGLFIRLSVTTTVPKGSKTGQA